MGRDHNWPIYSLRALPARRQRRWQPVLNWSLAGCDRPVQRLKGNISGFVAIGEQQEWHHRQRETPVEVRYQVDRVGHGWSFRLKKVSGGEIGNHFCTAKEKDGGTSHSP